MVAPRFRLPAAIPHALLAFFETTLSDTYLGALGSLRGRTTRSRSAAFGTTLTSVVAFSTDAGSTLVAGATSSGFIFSIAGLFSFMVRCISCMTEGSKCRVPCTRTSRSLAFIIGISLGAAGGFFASWLLAVSVVTSGVSPCVFVVGSGPVSGALPGLLLLVPLFSISFAGALASASAVEASASAAKA